MTTLSQAGSSWESNNVQVTNFTCLGDLRDTRSGGSHCIGELTPTRRLKRYLIRFHYSTVRVLVQRILTLRQERLCQGEVNESSSFDGTTSLAGSPLPPRPIIPGFRTRLPDVPRLSTVFGVLEPERVGSESTLGSGPTAT